ncbi:MAG: glycosyltransferase family 4 protein [Candidatus Thermoplasmatota archaeon]
MNICLVSDTLPLIGGAEFYAYELCKELTYRKHNVTLLTKKIGSRDFYRNFPFNVIPCRIINRRGFISFSTLLSYIFSFLRLRIEGKSFDIIHGNMIMPEIMSTIFAKFIFRANLVITEHGNAELIETSLIHRSLAKILLYFSDRVICVSDEIKDAFVKLGKPLDYIYVIPTGIVSTFFEKKDKRALREKHGFKENEKILLYMGGLKKVKGIDVLIRSFPFIQQKLKDVRLVIVGEGDEKKKLVNYAKELNLVDIEFRGVVEHDTVSEIMGCADVFLLVSISEGMPTVVLEALASGLPVVGTDVGDLKKVVKNGVTGYIIRERDELEIAKAVISVLTCECNIEKEKCREVVEGYKWPNIAEKIIDVYEKMLDNKN